MQMHTSFLSLGSNLGNRVALLDAAIRTLQEKGLLVLDQSPVFETDPWGFETGSRFVNQVIRTGSHHSPEELLALIRDAEGELGRVRTGKTSYEDRLIDIDILFYDNLVLKTDQLEIPHPRIAERRFVLAPLACIAPGLIHPVHGISVKAMHAACSDPGEVRLLLSDEISSPIRNQHP